MNYQNIVNGEKRIFPYYKGVFLGFTDFGYANKKSAQKFMSPIPPADIYERFGGEEQYKRTHGYLYGIVTKEPYAFYSRRRFLYRDDMYNFNIGRKVFLKDLPSSEQEKIWNKLVVDGLNSRYMMIENGEESAAFEKEFGLFPRLFIDMGDYDKMNKKIRTEEVEYREGIVEIKVTFLDKTPSK